MALSPQTVGVGALPSRALAFLIGFLLILALAVAPAYSADKPSMNATAECQVVVLPTQIALKLMPELVDDALIDGAFTRIQEMIASGEAELVANLIARAALSENSTAGAVDEVRYPTEFEPPALPNPLPKENAIPILQNWPIVGFTPTGFETRNVGPRIDFSPEKLDPEGKQLWVRVVAEDVRLLQFVGYDAGRLPTGEMLKIEQPKFHSISSKSEMWVKSGKRLLVTAHKIPGEKPMMELFFLRVLF